MSATRVRREDVQPGQCLCDYCTGKCCRYLSLPIPTPVTRRDFDAVLRYLEDDRTTVYLEKGTWYLLVMTRCKYLTRDNRCRIYLNRPKICREYTTDECEYDSDWTFEKVFETPEQLREYLEAVLPPRRGAGVRPVPDRARRRATFSIPLETPRTRDDYDAIRWYLAHGQTRVVVEDRRWSLLVLAPGREGVPGRVPAKVFETPEQLWEYAEAVLPPRRRRRRPGPSLPVITINGRAHEVSGAG